MTKKSAVFCSTLGHPFLLLPLVLAWLTIRRVGLAVALPILGAILASMAFMVALLYYRKKRGEITNWDVSRRKERARNIYQPILMLTGIMTALMYYFKQAFVGEVLFFGAMISACYAINSRLKVSQHTVMAYYTAFLALPAQIFIGLGMLVFAPFIGWSRVVLGRHTRKEVLVGTAVGILFGVVHLFLFA